MVSRFLTVTVSVVAVLALSACESTSWKGQPAKAVNAKTGAPEAQGPGPVIPPVERAGMQTAPAAPQNFPPPNDRDLMVISDKLAGGSIEIYDLESAQPYGGLRRGGSMDMSVSPVAAGGMPSSTDSSVVIFPVDGTYAGQAHSTWPNSLLPVNTAGYAGGSASLEGGRASPHVGSGYAPSQIFFKHGSARLGSGDKQILRQVADQAKFSPVERISVEGHASTRTGVSDPVEAKIINLKQSMNRAFNVSSQLIRNGVPAEKVKTTVWGDTKNDGGSEAQNRRVDVITGGQ